MMSYNEEELRLLMDCQLKRKYQECRMESSDDSFVWTIASSDSEVDSETMSERKMNNNDRDEELKSGKKYKKQLQKQLFEGRGSPRGARVKCEPPSDTDCAPPPAATAPTPDPAPDTDPDDSYLALRVKQELAVAATHDTTTLSDFSVTHRSRKSKKKKRKRERDDPSDGCDDRITSSRIEDETLDSASSTPRKKMFKGERGSGEAKSYEMNGMMIEDKFSAEETVVEARPSSEGRRRPPISNGTGTDGTDRSAERISKVKPNGVFPSVEFISDESGDDDDAEENRKSRTVLASHPVRRSSTREGEPPDERAADAPAPHGSHRTSKLSDRIRFEDDDTADDTMDVDSSEIPGESRVPSTKLLRYVSSRGHLRAPARRPPPACRLTSDDELWLLTCPRDLHVNALRGTSISLDEDAKCRIKVDGQTYNGSVDNRDARINVLSVEHERTVIVNVPISGTVRFRKRIPKAHFVEDGNVHDRTNFIPLPETKRRHPLFGPDYRRAVRIPTSVKDRLNRPDVEDLPTRKKKKHKKERLDADAPPSPPPPPPPPPVEEPRRSKKRKHKHSDTEEPTVKKKRVKHEPSSAGAGAWDSEKAIEENLFNF